MEEYITRFMPIHIEKYKKSNLFQLANMDCLKINGFGNLTNTIDLQWDLIKPGAFSNSIENFNKNGTLPKMLCEHNSNFICGEWNSVSEEKYGLKVSGYVTNKEVIAGILSQKVNGLSIGFQIPEKEYEYQKRTVYNKKKGLSEERWIRVIKTCILVEISIVEHPANDHSRFNIEAEVCTAR